jgi:excinuclease ABC subunit A
LEKASGNNLKDVDVIFPLGLFNCVTGVSGSGKSSLVNGTLAPLLRRKLGLNATHVLPCQTLRGSKEVDKLVQVDQKPIGRTPRGCAATYSGVFDEIRKVFASTKLARQRGFGVSRFSFNSKSGWCPECQGYGMRRMTMNFLPDMFVECTACQGQRFNLQTLQVRYADLSIADVLAMPIREACHAFRNFSRIHAILKSLEDVGLGYLPLGQPSTTLSGGEAQRIKLATELSKKNTGNTVYLLDEPTTGLHFEDIRQLLLVLQQLVDAGNTVIVIEHNLDVIKSADWIVDMGPEGGDGGGSRVAMGTPEEVAAVAESFTGSYLKEVLACTDPA